MIVRALIPAIVAALACSTPALAQTAAPAPAIVPPGPPAANGEGLYWSADVQKKGLSPDHEVAMSIFTWTPNYRVAVLRRAPYADPAKVHPEMHEDKTQIYFILSGSGTQVLGGKPNKVTGVVDGNHSSEGPLVGGSSYHIKAGDVIVIPPLTWHQTLPDAGQPITYQMVDVKTPTRMP